jgi:DNA gyrase subunit A
MSTFKGEEGHFLTVTEKGFGKRTAVGEYPCQGRGGMGVINVRVGEKNGNVVNTCRVLEDSSAMLITGQGQLIQLDVADIRDTQTRAAYGVKCIELQESDYVASVTVVASEEGPAEAVLPPEGEAP